MTASTSPRRWIIDKSRRLCPRPCTDYTTSMSVVKISDPVKGIIHRKCRQCGAEESNQLDNFKDKRPCKRCEVVHDVTVSFWQGNERWKEQCSLCDLELSAAHHYNTAKIFFARAAKLRSEEKRKQIRAAAGKSVRALVMTEIAMGAAPAIATNTTIRGLIEAEETEKKGDL